MHRKLAQIETEALKLGVRSRAHLARKLLESLDPPTETNHERAWYDEAEQRMQAFREGKIEAIPAREVLRRLRSPITKNRLTG
jgi:putative addiction module component (TIGR02574 family)